MSQQEQLRQALQLLRGGDLARAETIYRAVLADEPRNFDANHMLGIVRLQQGRLPEALALIDIARQVEPRSASALSNYAMVLAALDRPADALAGYDAALAVSPDDPELHYNRATALDRLGRAGEAIAAYDRAIDLAPGYAQALNNRGSALLSLDRPAEALANFDAALTFQPGHLEARINRATALLELRRFEAALAALDQILAGAPDHAGAHYNRGNALLALDRPAEALAAFDRALAIRPGLDTAHNNRGNALVELGRLDEALEAFRQAVALAPDRNFKAMVGCLETAARMCDWTATVPQAADLLARCDHPAFDGPPLPLLALCDDPALHRATAEAYVRQRTKADAPPVSPVPKMSAAALPAVAVPPLADESLEPSRRLRLGYLSADFNQHAVSLLIAGLIELHDRTAFEVHGFSAAPDDGSPLRQRLHRAFDRWSDVEGVSDRDLVARIRDAGIDILIDLGGHTKGSRMLALAPRPAPVQVSFLGYVGSLGAPFIDYTIADPHIAAAGLQEHHHERFVLLPDCFQCNDRHREIAAEPPTRDQCGLPADAFVFCCFNTAAKLSRETFDTWMRVLSAVPRSVLWLIGDNRWARANLAREAQARGVAPSRIVFAERTAYRDYLARLRLADLFLDTWPYNAGTTASDALWAGVPVLTFAGRSFASRMAGSLLHAVGLPELVTATAAEYEAAALRLATLPVELAALRERLDRNRATCPLFDTARYCRHLEAGYRQMWALHRRGEAPRTIHVGHWPSDGLT